MQYFIVEYLFQYKLTYILLLCCVSLASRFMMINVTVMSHNNMYKQKFLPNNSMFNKILDVLRYGAH